MSMTHPPETLAEGLAKLVGEPLSCVVFVEDYVQLGFNGPGLTAFTHPTITSGPDKWIWDQVGYRDALCRQISRKVERTAVDKQQVSIIFEGGAVISISLRDEDYCGPEALLFTTDKDRFWVV